MVLEEKNWLESTTKACGQLNSKIETENRKTGKWRGRDSPSANQGGVVACIRLRREGRRK
jgi:hypothetical protein